MTRPKAFAAALAIALAVQAQSCFPGGESTTAIDGPYCLSSIDIQEDTTLYYNRGDEAIGRVGATVFAAGADAKFVIAKRHPDDNRRITEYFILERAKDSFLADPSASVTGPLTESEFQAARRRLGVSPRLNFTIVLHGLE